MMAEKTNRQALINQGFDIEKVYLGRNERGLDSLDVLVVAEPLEPFSEVELDAIETIYREWPKFDCCRKTEHGYVFTTG